MIVRNLRPHKVIRYTWKELTLGLISSTLILWLFYLGHYKWLTLNYAPFTVLGTALSNFLAFRSNSAYGRWNQAAQVWMTMRSSSRVFVRLIKTVVDGHSNLSTYNKKLSDRYIQEAAYRQIAWLYAVRLSLRESNNWDELKPYLSTKELAQLKKSQNKPVCLMARQGAMIYEGLQKGILQGFDSFQLETQLSALANAHATAEQIKEIPIPKPYGSFTQAFL
jgi:putative membrane protein